VQLAEPDLLRSMPFLRPPFQALMVAVKRRVSIPLLVAHKGVSVSSYRVTVVRIATGLLVALLALPLTACRDTDSGLDPPPGPVVYHPHDPGGFYPDDRSVYPDLGSGTNHCAFPGDQLCPDTPVRVPPPNLQGW
jgi:hypothetical protein